MYIIIIIKILKKNNYSNDIYIYLHLKMIINFITIIMFF